MDARVKQHLLEANKLIFVKQYGEAEAVIEEILRLPEGRGDLLIHMRRVELAAMLGKLARLREIYLEELTNRERDPSGPMVAETALAMVEQHGEMVPPADSVARYQDIIKRYGASAAAYYGIGFSMESQGNIERAVFNYEQAVAANQDWYPAFFGLSQLYYQKGDDKRGDQYFFQFEQAAPYNVYGNFETHRKLSLEFLEEDRFAEAEAAIHALSTWWLDNKGQCPPEVQIYESLATAKISEAQGETKQADIRRTRAKALAMQLLDETDTEEGVMYFVAKVFEEFSDFPIAFQFYKKILRRTGKNPALVQKIGGQFLSMGEFKLAKELFEDAYAANPDHPEVRFCLLVSSLKVAGVNVEEYLIGRERLRQLVDNPADKVELLALLHSLMAKFQGDADVQGHVADVYLRLGNLTRAETHYRKMFELDGACRTTALKFAAYLMQHGDPEIAIGILNKIDFSSDERHTHKTEVYWLKSTYYSRKNDFRAALDLLKKALASDPWNVSYLLQEVINLSQVFDQAAGQSTVDQQVQLLSTGHDGDVVWDEYDRRTDEIDRVHGHELAYSRRKLRFLYANGGGETLRELVKAACRFDAARGTYDIIRLLNTNFDSASLYWALGILFKDLWQLETATMWFEQTLLYQGLDATTQSRTYLELSDCYVWRNINLPKAIEYVKIAMDMGERANGRALTVLAHAYLRSGQIRQAQVYLDQTDREKDSEATYLLGLLHYRNGARQRANEIWKPLLTVRTENLRFHNIKQEILRYYFDGSPYLKAN